MQSWTFYNIEYPGQKNLDLFRSQGSGFESGPLKETYKLGSNLKGSDPWQYMIMTNLIQI